MGETAFHEAATIDEALALVGDGSDARVVAGGSDLVVGARHGKALPPKVVAIHRVAELTGIAVDGGALRLGALATHSEIVDDDRIRDGWTALADASALVGSHATRNVGTIGGNLMNASPAMETGGPLVVLGARVVLRSAAGEREVPVDELWTGPGRTAAQPGELLTGVVVPATVDRSGSAYVRLEYRRAMEIAVVGASAAVELGADGSVASARIALTAVAPTIVRSPSAEAALVGGDGGEAALDAVAAGASADATPISDLRAREDYRRAMIGVIARRAASVALLRARGESFPIPATPAFMEGSAR